MLVSVIVPAWNAAPFIRQSLRSLVSQSGNYELEILVIDDGSTDHTPRIVAGMAKQHPAVRLVSSVHRGIAATRNTGLDHLSDRTEYVTFQDADDIAYPNRITRQLERLEDDSSLDAVYGLLCLFDKLDARTLMPSADSRTLICRDISLSAGLYRRTKLDDIGRFDESLYQAEDTDFLFRLAESRAVVFREDEIATFYRRHKSNITNDVLSVQREFMRAINKSLRRRRSHAGSAPIDSRMFSDRNRIREPIREFAVRCRSNTRL